MILRGRQLAEAICEKAGDRKDPLIVTPLPDLDKLKKSVDASLDMRLGTWFAKKKARNRALVDFYDPEMKPSDNLASIYYVPFGKDFILHPNNFVLAVTLEWIRLPSHLAAFVMGRSSWGRHGLIIETAPGVHPGFSGCLTLEMANVGDVPIRLRPGARICQLYFHETNPLEKKQNSGRMIGRRQPFAPTIEPDEFERELERPD